MVDSESCQQKLRSELVARLREYSSEMDKYHYFLGEIIEYTNSPSILQLTTPPWEFLFLPCKDYNAIYVSILSVSWYGGEEFHVLVVLVDPLSVDCIVHLSLVHMML